MATLGGQRAQFTWALNQYNITDDPDEKDKFARRMARYIASAATHGFTVEEVTQKQSYPAAEVEKYLTEITTTADPEISEENAIQSLATKVDISDVIREGEENGTLYAYGYRCAPDRLKVGSTEGDAIQRIAAQIFTSTPDKPVLLVEIKSSACRALEKAIHGILETRGKKVMGGGDEWFRATRDEILEVYRFISK
ncbi:MAG: GIY-YIG nuclease family protein [Xanthobacteraceae bacterium]